MVKPAAFCAVLFLVITGCNIPISKNQHDIFLENNELLLLERAIVRVQITCSVQFFVQRGDKTLSLPVAKFDIVGQGFFVDLLRSHHDGYRVITAGHIVGCSYIPDDNIKQYIDLIQFSFREGDTIAHKGERTNIAVFYNKVSYTASIAIAFIPQSFRERDVALLSIQLPASIVPYAIPLADHPFLMMRSPVTVAGIIVNDGEDMFVWWDTLLQGISDEKLCLAQASYSGLSGSPVVLWDTSTRRYMAVGVVAQAFLIKGVVIDISWASRVDASLFP